MYDVYINGIISKKNVINGRIILITNTEKHLVNIYSVCKFYSNVISTHFNTDNGRVYLYTLLLEKFIIKY